MNLDSLVTFGIVLGAIIFLIFKFKAKSKEGCGKSCGCAIEKKSLKTSID